jgi:2,3-bisphosphoglycerate-independent phosphoglycerate mutase
MDSVRPVALIVLDGWGLAPPGPGNAVALAETPTFDRIMAEYPHGTLTTSGRSVGLPDGQMGNSEVGHLNLGAGFVVDQELTRLFKAIDDGTFYNNGALRGAVEHALARGTALHLLGLVGEGGVHAHTRHLLAVVEIARRAGLGRVFLHAFTDGRDTAPDSGLGYVRDVVTAMDAQGVGRIATVSGRYYAMDRDRRWERTARAWAAIVDGHGATAPDAGCAIERSYAAGVSDEFIVPTVITGADDAPVATVSDGDAVVMFNFRADRMRQFLGALTDPALDAFERAVPRDLHVVTMTAYVRDQAAAVAFRSLDVEWPLARVLSERGLRQYHTAETEKYAHVTYFFNGGREAPFPGEDRVLVPSPKVPTYDLQPEMSAETVTDRLVERIGTGTDDFLVVNYANPDMVGHTGDIAAAVRAVGTVDACLGRVLAALDAAGGVALVTADHGNAEVMVDPVTGRPHTAHTLDRVPLVVVGRPFRRTAGRTWTVTEGLLSDVAPTVLALMGIPAPASMTGRCLLSESGAGSAPPGGDG